MEQGRSRRATRETAIHRKAADQNCGQQGITRQPPAQFGGDTGERAAR
jgi:hypothetical protein